MAKQLQTFVVIGGKVSKTVAQSVRAVQKSFSSLNASVNRVSKNIAIASAAMATATVAAAVKVTKAGAEFEKQMSNVSTLLDGNVKARIDELGDQILAVKSKVKKPIEDLTNGAYQIISAFGDAPDSAQKLEIAAKAAKAGIAETLDAVNLFSAQMKGYGNTSAEFMQQCADMNFQVVKLGQTTFPELAAALPSVVPLAKTMGVSIQEVNGYLATMTGVTGNASEVSTQLASALTAMLKPSKEMTAKIKALGFADGQAMIKTRGLQGSLEALRKTVKTDLEFGKLFGRKEGVNFALAATGTLADTVRVKTKAMYEAVGSTEAAFEKQEDNMIERWHAISNAVEVAQIKIGKKFTPFLKTLGEKVLPVVEKSLARNVELAGKWADKLEEWVKVYDFGKAYDEFKTKLDTAREAIGKWLPILAEVGKKALIGAVAVKGIAAAVKIWTVAQLALNAALGAPLITIAAIVAAAWYLYNNWDEVCSLVREKWGEFTTWFEGNFPETYATCKKYIDEAKGYWETAVGIVKGKWSEAMEFVMRKLEEFKKEFPGLTLAAKVAWEMLKTGFATSLKQIETTATVVIAGVKLAWKTLCTQLSTEWELACNTVSGVLHMLDHEIQGLAALWKGDFKEAGSQFKQAFLSAFDAVKKNAVTLWKGIREAGKNVGEFLSTLLEPPVEAIKRCWNGCVAFVKGKWDEAVAWVTRKIDEFKREFPGLTLAAEGAWTAIEAGFTVAWTVIEAVAKPIIDGLKFSWDLFCTEFKGLWEAAKADVMIGWEVIKMTATVVIEAVKGAWKNVCTQLSTAWDVVCNTVSGTLHTIDHVIQGIVALWKGDFDEAGEQFKKAFTSAFDMVKKNWETMWNGLKEVAKNVVDTITNIFGPIVDGFGRVMDVVRSTADKVSGAVMSSVQAVMPGKAAGGFTHGVSICGEAGTEAVISFDPRYRAANREYLAQAAELLGMHLTEASEISSTTEMTEKLVVPAYDSSLSEAIAAALETQKDTAAVVLPDIPAKAAGGFTKGIAICGEAGTEAVISFDPAYRAENQRYVATAASLLGGSATFAPRVASSPAQSSFRFGDIHISPVFNGSGAIDRKGILRALEDCIPDVLDKLQEEANARKLHQYA